MKKSLQPKLLLTRRGFILATAFGLVGLPAYLSREKLFSSAFKDLYLSAMNRNEQSYIVAIDSLGKIHFEIPVGARCHGIAPHPIRANIVTVYPKRPGYLAYVVNFDNGQIENEFKTAANRYFYGHGTYSSDGRYLFSSENDYENRRGLITIRDTSNYQVLEEIESGGIGPHDLVSQENSLIVANGGIFEHPNAGDAREKLNIDSMDPSLVYLDLKSRKVLERYKPANHQQGIRHLSVTPKGDILTAIQYEGSDIANNSLVAVSHAGNAFEYFNLPENLSKITQGYALSIANADDVVAVSFSKANFVGFWNINTKEFLGKFDTIDPGGISVSADTKKFLLSSSSGFIHSLDLEKLKSPVEDYNKDVNIVYSNPTDKWDNHLSVALKSV